MNKLEIRWLRPKLLEVAHELGNSVRGGRKGVYSDNWAIVPYEDNVTAAKYKLGRAIYTEEPFKRLDDVVDALNYVRFAMARDMAAALDKWQTLSPEEQEKLVQKYEWVKTLVGIKERMEQK